MIRLLDALDLRIIKVRLPRQPLSPRIIKHHPVPLLKKRKISQHILILFHLGKHRLRLIKKMLCLLSIVLFNGQMEFVQHPRNHL